MPVTPVGAAASARAGVTTATKAAARSTQKVLATRNRSSRADPSALKASVRAVFGGAGPAFWLAAPPPGGFRLLVCKSETDAPSVGGTERGTRKRPWDSGKQGAYLEVLAQQVGAASRLAQPSGLGHGR